jgi:hypothetical protein
VATYQDSGVSPGRSKKDGIKAVGGGVDVVPRVEEAKKQSGARSKKVEMEEIELVC